MDTGRFMVDFVRKKFNKERKQNSTHCSESLLTYQNIVYIKIHVLYKHWIIWSFYDCEYWFCLIMAGKSIWMLQTLTLRTNTWQKSYGIDQLESTATEHDGKLRRLRHYSTVCMQPSRMNAGMLAYVYTYTHTYTHTHTHTHSQENTHTHTNIQPQ